MNLNNKVEIPLIGYGTGVTSPWICENGVGVKYFHGIKALARNVIDKDYKQIKVDFNLCTIVKNAPKYKLSLIDTARGYGSSEFLVGKAIKSNRNNYFISTKLSNADQRGKKVKEALESSLQMLKIEYVDLYLMHWPQTDTFLDSWMQMEALYREGLCKAIGVCNFNVHHLEKLKRHATITPAVNQFEYHPLFQQRELEVYCREKEIKIMAYTATGRMDKRIAENKKLINLAKKYDATVPQIILAWHMQEGRIPIVNTSSLKHVEENMKSCQIRLLDEEINIIQNININCRLRFDPDNCDFTKL